MTWYYRLAIPLLLMAIGVGLALILMMFVGQMHSPDDDECCTQIRGCQESTLACP